MDKLDTKIIEAILNNVIGEMITESWEDDLMFEGTIE